MNIGQAASASGISAKMIRYYESVGLIPRAARTPSGYRHYTDEDVHTLTFIRRARDLGFSVEAINELLGLWRDTHRSSADVKALVLAQIAELRTRISKLEGLVATLEHLAHHCQGNDRPACPILDDLSAGGGAAPEAGRHASLGRDRTGAPRARRGGSRSRSRA